MRAVFTSPRPLHVGHGRQAALGDAIAGLLESQGAAVTRECDAAGAGGPRGDRAASVRARAKGRLGEGAAFPEDGYRGEYVRDMAAGAVEDPGTAARLSAMGADEARSFFREYALCHILDWQKRSLAQYEVHFDKWFSERELRATGAVEKMIGEMEESGHTYREEGALWFRSSEFGDDKDRVIRRSNGEYTYFAADAAYYLNKGDRGFAHKIYLLGADHHGYVHRLKALAGAAGDDPRSVLRLAADQVVRVGTFGVNRETLNGQLNVMQVGLDFCFLGLFLHLDVVWQRNRGQNTNNDDSHQELNKRKALGEIGTGH